MSLQLMPLYVMDIFMHIPGLPGLFVSCVVSGSLRFVDHQFSEHIFLFFMYCINDLN